MVHYIILTLKILSISIGVFLIISRVFLFEETQGKIQSRIETFWIQVDDFQKTAISKHVAFIKVVSKVISSGLDRIFGRALFSLQSLIVSVCYAVITCLIVLLCFLRYGSGNWNEDFLKFLAVYMAFAWFPFLISFFRTRTNKRLLFVWLVTSLNLALINIAIPAFDLLKLIHYSDVKWVRTVFIAIYICVAISLGLTLFLFFSCV